MVQNKLKKLNQSIVNARRAIENFSKTSHQKRPEPQVERKRIYTDIEKTQYSILVRSIPFIQFFICKKYNEF